MAQSASLDNEQIYQTVAREILHFRHKPGDMISENTLCQRFGVSRTPARSVLQRLQENGLADRYREAEQLDIVSADLLERNRNMMKKGKEGK